MNPSRWNAFGSMPIALALTLAVATAAAAQVASLAGPDETPEPDAAEIVLDFEDQNEALLAFAACMRENGVDMDDPQVGERGGRGFFGGGPGGADDGIDRFGEEFQAAQQACGAILEASRPEIDPEAEQERLEEQLALAQCIRDHGYEDYPDPAIGTDGRLERVRGQEMSEIGIDRRSAEFQEVIGACRDELGLEQGPGFGHGAAIRGD
jgi:hypothetical protein